MQKLFRCVVTAAVLAASASLAAAGELKLTLSNGRATLIAQDVPLRQILDEWARVGKTTIVNGDKLVGPPITVQLVDRPESEVLELLLRSASGYIAAPRDGASPAGPSMFAKVMILPVSRGPVGAAASTPPPPFGARPNPAMQPMPTPVADDDDGEVPQQMPPGVGPQMQPGIGPQMQPGPTPFQPQPTPQPMNGEKPVLTAPRPGMLPAPPPGQPNPYGPPVQAPVVRPGGPGGPGGPGDLEPNDDDYPTPPPVRRRS